MSGLVTFVRRARSVPPLYRKHFADCGKQRQFLSATSFFFTFATVRAITHSIRAGIAPFKNITPGGRHIHDEFALSLNLADDCWTVQGQVKAYPGFERALGMGTLHAWGQGAVRLRGAQDLPVGRLARAGWARVSERLRAPSWPRSRFSIWRSR